MRKDEFQKLLVDLDACEEARKWCAGKSLAQAWKTGKRGDWMLWLCGKMADTPKWPTRKQVVLVACFCAELTLKYVSAEEDRPRKCIETVRAWVAGTASIEEVREARRDAYAYAAAADTAVYAAADAAAYAAADADARTKTLNQCAKIARKSLQVPGVKLCGTR
jgi:hypothetical protein